jgi:hypothetical protein
MQACEGQVNGPEAALTYVQFHAPSLEVVPLGHACRNTRGYNTKHTQENQKQQSQEQGMAYREVVVMENVQLRLT